MNKKRVKYSKEGNLSLFLFDYKIIFYYNYIVERVRKSIQKQVYFPRRRENEICHFGVG
jgi:hypothetical protein